MLLLLVTLFCANDSGFWCSCDVIRMFLKRSVDAYKMTPLRQGTRIECGNSIGVAESKWYRFAVLNSRFRAKAIYQAPSCFHSLLSRRESFVVVVLVIGAH